MFDPYISNHVENIHLKDIFVNGEKLMDASDMVRIVEFDDINADGNSTGRGTVGNVSLE